MIRLIKLILILSIFTVNNCWSQNILDLFKIVPDSSVLGLTEKQRGQIIKNFEHDHSRLTTDLMYSIDEVDIPNGFLSLSEAIEGRLDMCYWNKSNGDKIIAIYIEGCGPVCYVQQLDFFNVVDGKLKSLNRKLIIPDIYQDFFKEDISTAVNEMKEDDLIATLLYQLPRKGKDITARWGNEDSDDAYRKYGKGNRMTLIWNDGVFRKGDIYWNKK